MTSQDPSSTTTLDALTKTFSTFGIAPPDPSNITSISDALATLNISHPTSQNQKPDNSVYTILTEVTPTSLHSVDYAIELYALTIGFYEAQLALDKEYPQLEVVRDLMVARKCWVILHEQRRAILMGEGNVEVEGVWGELRKFGGEGV